MFEDKETSNMQRSLQMAMLDNAILQSKSDIKVNDKKVDMEREKTVAAADLEHKTTKMKQDQAEKFQSRQQTLEHQTALAHVKHLAEVSTGKQSVETVQVGQEKADDAHNHKMIWHKYDRIKGDLDVEQQVKCKEQIDNGRRRMELAIAKEDESACVVRGEGQEVLVRSRANKQRNEDRDEALKAVMRALKIVPGTNAEKCSKCCLTTKLSVARFMVLLVIAGCELDLYGFVLALTDYWSNGDIVMRCMLIIGPTGYVFALCAYMGFLYCQKRWQKRAEAETLLGEDRDGVHGSASDAFNEENGVSPHNDDDDDDVESQHASIFSNDANARNASIQATTTKAKELRGTIADKRLKDRKDLLPKTKPREPVVLSAYHFVPILRFYLLVKDFEANDVEALFRVNGLSTFTLGFAQIVCMIIGLSAGYLSTDDIYIKIGIVAQTVNILNTIVYFGTNIPDTMKNSVRIDAVLYNNRQYLQDEFTQYEEALRKYNETGLKIDEQVLETCFTTAKSEILKSSKTPNLNLDIFEMGDLMEIRRGLAEKSAMAFAKI